MEETGKSVKEQVIIAAIDKLWEIMWTPLCGAI